MRNHSRHSWAGLVPAQRSNRPRASLAGLLGVLTALALANPLAAQTNLLKIDYQWADSIAGPWTKPPSNQTYVQPDGSIVTLTDDPQKHFRLSIEPIDLDDIQSPAVHVAQLRDDTRTIALHHLEWIAANIGLLGSDAPDGVSWTNAQLAPVAFKMFDPAYRNGEEPAYIEFKVISPYQPAARPIAFLADNEVPPACDLGYILVSLNEGDAPVPEYDTQGATPCQDLLRRVGHVSNLRIMRFGPSFTAVENEQGELLANAGADPFRIPEEFLEYRGQTFNGFFDSETSPEPPLEGWGGPKMKPVAYESYAEFKEDYIKNPVYQEMRARKTRMVSAEWILERGGEVPRPAEFIVGLRTPVEILSGKTIARYFLDDENGEEQPLAQITPIAGGGLLVSGRRAGESFLTVQTSEGIAKYWLRVVQEVGTPGAAGFEDMAGGDGGAFVPGWQMPNITSKAGGWAEQVRYYQTKDYNRWCSKVGCGPVAWAMLFAYWDRHSVPATFFSSLPGDLDVSDAPKFISEAPSKIHKVYDDLHEYCDVICSPSGAGATPPGDMIEGGLGYLLIPIFSQKLGLSYRYSWDLMDPDWNEPSSVVRESVKMGRPAVLGLGWMWHYVVAYAYLYQEYKVHPSIPPLAIRRWFRCNQGWGKSSGAWYSGYDTFLGATINPWQK